MAITIIEDIPLFNPAFNRMIVVADSTNVAQPSFKYLFDVYVNFPATVEVRRFAVIPEPDQNYGVVDVGRFVESALSSTLGVFDSTAAFAIGQNTNNSKSVTEVQVKYGEQYEVAGVLTDFPNLTTGSLKYAWNASIGYEQFHFFNAEDYLMSLAFDPAEFLTDQKTNKVSTGNLGWHHILSDTASDVDYLEIKTYDSSGILIQTVQRANSASTALIASKMYKVATAPGTLNALIGPFLMGAQPIITPSVASYTVAVWNTAPTILSELLSFTMEEPCRYTQRRVHFLNNYGSFDCFNLNLRSQEKRKTERQSYSYDKYPITATGTNFLLQDQKQVVNFTQTQPTLIVRSDYLTTEENTWLQQLVDSPEIYLEVSDNQDNPVQNFLAVESVIGDSWVEQETSIDKLWIMELELKFSQVDKRQRR